MIQEYICSLVCVSASPQWQVSVNLVQILLTNNYVPYNVYIIQGK